MDIEKLIEQLRYLADTPSYTAFHDAKEREIICDQCEADFCYDKQQDAHWCMYEALSRAATALSTLQAENAEMQKQINEFSEFLCHMTGGLLSKTNYTAREMISAAEDYQQDVCGECDLRAENEKLRAELERVAACVYYKPGGLCRYDGDDPANVCVLGPYDHEATAKEVINELEQARESLDFARTKDAETVRLGTELERVKEERDEAVQCIRGIAKSGRVWMCPYCVHAKDTTGGIAECELDVGVCMMPYSKFEWRGQKEG